MLGLRAPMQLYGEVRAGATMTNPCGMLEVRAPMQSGKSPYGMLEVHKVDVFVTNPYGLRRTAYGMLEVHAHE